MAPQPVEDAHAHAGKSVGDFVHAEGALIGSLSWKDFSDAFKEQLKDNWKGLAVEAAVGFVTGAAVAAVTRNPALVGRAIGTVLRTENPLALGEAMAPLVRPAVGTLPYAFGGLAAVDATHRLTAPAFDLMNNPNHLAADQKQFAMNLSGMVQDYSVMGVTGALGARFAFGRTAPYVNKGPATDFTTPQNWAEANANKLNKAARLTDPDKYVLQRIDQSTKVPVVDGEGQYFPADAEAVYDARFPAEEKQHVHKVDKETGEATPGGYNEKIEQGHNLMFVSRDKDTGEFVFGHTWGIHEVPDPAPQSQGAARDFVNWLKGNKPDTVLVAHGDFMWTNPKYEGQGIASDSYEKEIAELQEYARSRGKKLVGITGEMENPLDSAKALMASLKSLDVQGVSDSDPMQAAEKLWQSYTADHPGAQIQYQVPEGTSEEAAEAIKNSQAKAMGEKLMAWLADTGRPSHAAEKSEDDLVELGKSFIQLDERLNRRNFYWALPKAKIDTGVNWSIQEFGNFDDPNSPQPAEWTGIFLDPKHFSPVEAGYAFMTDEPGYTLPANHARVLEYIKANNYYRPSRGTAYSSAALQGVWSGLKPLTTDVPSDDQNRNA